MALAERALFFVLCVFILFSARLMVSEQIAGPMVSPDEGAYSSLSFELMNLSLYSGISIFGRHFALTANCLLTSLCLIALFFIFRRYWQEREAAIFSVLVACYGAFWAYSWLDMTEAVIFLGSLVAAYFFESRIVGLIPAMIKPLGLVSLFASRTDKHMLLAATGLMVAYCAMFWGAPEAGANWFMNTSLGIERLLAATVLSSYGLICIPFVLFLARQNDAYSDYVLRLAVFCFAFACLSAPMIPWQFMLVRYMEVPIILSFTCIRPALFQSKAFIMLFYGIMVPLVLSLLFDLLLGGVVFSHSRLLEPGMHFLELPKAIAKAQGWF